jgi:hypothetical protein
VPTINAVAGQDPPPAGTDYLFEFGLPYQKARAVRAYIMEESPGTGQAAESAEWSELILKLAATGDFATTTGKKAGME